MGTPPAPLASHDAPTSGGQGLIGPRPRSPPPASPEEDGAGSHPQGGVPARLAHKEVGEPGVGSTLHPAPSLLGWARGWPCGCCSTCQDPSRARTHTPRRPPAPFCRVSRTARSGSGRDGRRPPRPGAGSQPGQPSRNPRHGDPWPPPQSPPLPAGLGGTSQCLCTEAPLASVTGPAGPGALSASCPRD